MLKATAPLIKGYPGHGAFGSKAIRKAGTLELVYPQSGRQHVERRARWPDEAVELADISKRRKSGPARAADAGSPAPAP